MVQIKLVVQLVNATLTTEGIAVTLVFVDSTQGWLVTDSGLQTDAPTAAFITATGGTMQQPFVEILKFTHLQGLEHFVYRQQEMRVVQIQ